MSFLLTVMSAVLWSLLDVARAQLDSVRRVHRACLRPARSACQSAPALVIVALMSPFASPFASLAYFGEQVRAHGVAALEPLDVCALAQSRIEEFAAWTASFDALPPDEYLRDGGRYRRRRHSCFVVADDRVESVPRRAHWQPVEYNALHGGLERWFEPIELHVVESAAWRRLLRALAQQCSAQRGSRPWFVEAHQFRIDTTDGIGRPTPEGAHRDGVDFVAVILVQRVDIVGGETRVFEADGPHGLRFTMSAPWTLLFLDDARVIHESTPIQPLSKAAHRDTLVITFRAGGFQGAQRTLPDTRRA